MLPTSVFATLYGAFEDRRHGFNDFLDSFCEVFFTCICRAIAKRVDSVLQKIISSLIQCKLNVFLRIFPQQEIFTLSV
jgi:hypothetical protein